MKLSEIQTVRAVTFPKRDVDDGQIEEKTTKDTKVAKAEKVGRQPPAYGLTKCNP